MAAIDVVNRIFREFERYTGDGLSGEPASAPLPIGDPQSGPHNPKKSELRAGLLAPLSETEAFRDETEEFRDAAGVFRNQAEAFAALSGPTGVYAGTFTGDGVETTFTMSAAPSSAAHVWIAVDGVLQAPGTYTIDGTGLIFSEPPPETLDDIGDPVANISYRIVSIAGGEEVPPDGSVTSTKLAEGAVTTSKVTDKAVTLAKMQDIATKKIVGRDAAGTGAPELIDFTVAGLALLQAANVAAQVDVLGLTRISFAANKNGTNQTGVAANTSTKVTFGTEDWDSGGYYDPATSRFTPPAGKYRLTANVHIITPSDGQRIAVQIYKNGATIRSRTQTVGASSNSDIQITCLVGADGDDYFEVYAINYAASGTVSIGGGVSNSWFEGEVL